MSLALNVTPENLLYFAGMLIFLYVIFFSSTKTHRPDKTDIPSVIGLLLISITSSFSKGIALNIYALGICTIGFLLTDYLKGFIKKATLVFISGLFLFLWGILPVAHGLGIATLVLAIATSLISYRSRREKEREEKERKEKEQNEKKTTDE